MATIKIQRAVKEIGVNGGNISKAMRAAGYAPSTAARTDKLVKRKGFKELIEKELPDKMLLKVHKEGLGATKSVPQVVDRDAKGAPVYEYIKEEDFATRHKYLESGYKIKGKLKEVENPVIPQQTVIIINQPNGGNTAVGVQSKP